MINRLNLKIKQKGILPTIWLGIRYILRKTLGIDYRKEIWFERSLYEPIKKFIPRIDVEIKQVDRSFLDSFINIIDTNKYNIFRQRFNKNGICFVALIEKNPIAYSWISLKNEYESEIKIPVKVNKGEAYLYDDYVFPDYRNNNLHSILIEARLSYLQYLNYKKVITIVDQKNTYPLKTFTSAGFKPINSVSLFSLFGLKFHRWHHYKGNL